ncbi:MAG TPA: hypothetical protein PLP61_01850 [Nocardioides sp.]|nr:hypothetical protein [Nocardioides sp.]HQR25757.1 hypothetical protein [Nocardioides sp.]
MSAATEAPASGGPPEHEHAWQLHGVEYDDGPPVSRFECERCRQVRFSL